MTPADTARSTAHHARTTSRRTYRVRTPPLSASVLSSKPEAVDAAARVLHLDPDVRHSLRQRDIAALYRALQTAGVSQRSIANHTGQTQGEVSEILSGRRVQSITLLERIVDGLGISRTTIGLTDPEPSAEPVPVTAITIRPPTTIAPPPPMRMPPTIRNPGNGTGPTVDVPLWSGRNVWAFRQSLRHNIETFAEHLGVSAASVGRWESGGLPSPFQQSLLDTALKRTDPDTRIRFARLASEDILGANQPLPVRADPSRNAHEHGELAAGVVERR
jgi:transcriptional regulator with XRE-family HTH domain